ncbi:hypothetical protein GGS23DRAFT_607564 [Durotheca rogersii]|uniref:uncharacterized protein n=1 Tax=Durotheca rogersii TaxID=419775 RepID=UPI00221FA562|nr:uncharacterized protein GGS23DRAFT_607564 [Durotheca rogersii]KAI5859341.1 hypothetical protein GGS23DRAFT_607564 [Durotheca rogersii]
MVGVPGKYKGCNTCRARRVACDNARPLCKKCTDFGRECGGYERETVFIVGTPDDKGRCSSHPPRNQQGGKRTREKESRQPEKLALASIQPPQPAWADVISLSSKLGSYRVRFIALQTDLGSVVQARNRASRGNNEVTLSLGGFRALDVCPTFSQEPFSLKSHCFVHLPSKGGRESAGDGQEGSCLFLYEQNSSAAYRNEASWNDPAALADRIRESGPTAYQSFPEHHFFARVYRPNAIWAALLNRQPSFLCSPEWTVVPWERHPRTPLDDLLDIVVLLPSLFSRTDRIPLLEPTPVRYLKAKELLNNCVNIERQFDIWYGVLHQRIDESRVPPYWMAETMNGGTHVPFADAYQFPSPLMALVHVYYWAVLIGFHQCVYALLQIVFESGGENSVDPSMPPELPPGIDLQRYQPAQIGILAGNVCRSLEYALNSTGQPDLLASPLWVVSNFYSGMRRFGGGEMEHLWCTGFRGRLEAKVDKMNLWLRERKWTEIRKFG